MVETQRDTTRDCDGDAEDSPPYVVVELRFKGWEAEERFGIKEKVERQKKVFFKVLRYMSESAGFRILFHWCNPVHKRAVVSLAFGNSALDVRMLGGLGDFGLAARDRDLKQEFDAKGEQRQHQMLVRLFRVNWKRKLRNKSARPCLSSLVRLLHGLWKRNENKPVDECDAAKVVSTCKQFLQRNGQNKDYICYEKLKRWCENSDKHQPGLARALVRQASAILRPDGCRHMAAGALTSCLCGEKHKFKAGEAEVCNVLEQTMVVELGEDDWKSGPEVREGDYCNFFISDPIEAAREGNGAAVLEQAAAKLFEDCPEFIRLLQLVCSAHHHEMLPTADELCRLHGEAAEAADKKRPNTISSQGRSPPESSPWDDS